MRSRCGSFVLVITDGIHFFFLVFFANIYKQRNEKKKTMCERTIENKSAQIKGKKPF